VVPSIVIPGFLTDKQVLQQSAMAVELRLQSKTAGVNGHLGFSSAWQSGCHGHLPA
jgi:hypothetical protein